MAEAQSPTRDLTSGTHVPQKRALEDDHAPAVSSPLNPEAKARPTRPPPVQREQREKKETLKKREMSGRASTPDSKQKAPTTPSPMRYNIGPPKSTDFDPPRDPILVSHEPLPIVAYNPANSQQTELKRPADQ
jgi:COMPASS component BRE2